MVSWNLNVLLGWVHGDRMVELRWRRDKKCIWRSFFIDRIKHFVLELRIVDSERRILIERILVKRILIERILIKRILVEKILINSFDWPRVEWLKKHRVA